MALSVPLCLQIGKVNNKSEIIHINQSQSLQNSFSEALRNTFLYSNAMNQPLDQISMVTELK